LDPTFKKGSKLYDRVEWCFTNTITGKYKFYLSLVNPDGQSQTVNFAPDIPFKVCKPEITRKDIDEPINFPDFNNGKHKKQFLIDSFEWIGLAGIRSPRYHST
jgi:Ribonuclease P 40kDa (Rpp40) subunit